MCLSLDQGVMFEVWIDVWFLGKDFHQLYVWRCYLWMSKRLQWKNVALSQTNSVKYERFGSLLVIKYFSVNINGNICKTCKLVNVCFHIPSNEIYLWCYLVRIASTKRPIGLLIKALHRYFRLYVENCQRFYMMFICSVKGELITEISVNLTCLTLSSM